MKNFEDKTFIWSLEVQKNLHKKIRWDLFMWRMWRKIGHFQKQDIALLKNWPFTFFFFWLCLWHVKVPGPGIELAPQQRPEPLQWQWWQCGILNLLCHKGTPMSFNFRNKTRRKFPGCLVVRTPSLHHCGPGSAPGLGSKIPHQAAARHSQKKVIN